MSSHEQPEQPDLPDQPDTEREPETVVEDLVTVRRSPRYINFMVLGAIVGAIAAFVFTVAYPENAKFGAIQVFGFLLLAGVAIGVTAGCLVALVLDRVVSRTAQTVVADRLKTHDSHAAPAGESDAPSGTHDSSETSP